MPAGRPTKYDPKYCDGVIEHALKGKSLTAFAGSIRVARSTINEWIDHHEEFSEAVKIAKAVRVDQLEDDLLSAEQSAKVTSRIFALKNADPDEWKDRQDHRHGGDPDNPVAFAQFAPRSADVEEWERRHKPGG